MSFFEKLHRAIAKNNSLLVVGLDPNPEMLPHFTAEDQSLEHLVQDLADWLHHLITTTQTLVCAYKPSFGFYKSLGAPGLELLSEVLNSIPDDLPVILDAKHGDLNTSSIFARTVFEQWQVDAVTLNPYAGQDQAAPFLVYPDHGIFLLCRTSNPAAMAIQGYPDEDSPLFLKVVQEVQGWGTPEQVYLEIGTSTPDTLARVRTLAPERLILLRSLWKREENLENLLKAGLNENGEGLLIPVPQDLLSQDTTVATTIQSLNNTINPIRTAIQQQPGSHCHLWTPDVCFLEKHPHQDLILQLYDIGCILFGEYQQASGATFSYYIDLRKIISQPQIFQQVLNAYAEILQTLTFDRIAGIPYGSLPTATGLSLRLEHPMIFPRKEVKAHGTRRVIEGNFQPGETVVVVDDILISGNSAIEGAKKLEFAGLVVEDIVVFLDHEREVKDRLQKEGYRAHSVLTLSEVTQTLYEAGRIAQDQFEALTAH
ncbi:bifunctional orotidine-5'-phosphate decarboxylase/orotate phosphoribosyltransferase [Spirulina sp. CS-785/01]|uniref:bifunctional orotidine-5'-phosphate decarboxylase/orotate phosphoribosyltransferase n=1 Tax=Spirulina sp. CS-785/01 TaxID=3021716 RepID=UPI00232F2457|nr:bifunctional orotidine-5'-phosphate decarboxylase/orotate phosphoribosyltransferase [Spirulina sp. CS-785/01]MDB9312886.1 bifunctional orotidine-5'-phosphate decarboxylase/orotate phosphoribosyltransferase [Spirulina sp. CS-785/01]